MSGFAISHEQFIEQLENSGNPQLIEQAQQMRGQLVKKNDHVAELLAERDFIGALVHCGSGQVADKLVEYDRAHKLTDDELREILVHEWDRCEARGHRTSELLGYLRRVAPLSDDELEPITEPTRIFRGNLGEDPRLGLSWTLDLAQAEWFASYCTSIRARFLGLTRADGGEPRPTVWAATVAPEHVLGYFGGRGEQEIVPDPRHLTDVTAIRQAVAAEDE